MGQAVDEAQRERDLSRARLAATLDVAEARVRTELDWKARLRRDGARYAVIGAVAVIGLTTIVVLKLKFGKRAEEPQPLRVGGLDDISDQLTQLRDEMEKLRKRQAKDGSPLWQKAGLRAVAAAGAAAGSVAARQMMERYQPEPEPADAG